MKKIVALMLLAVVAATPVFAEQGNNKHGHDGMNQGGMMGNGSGMGMMHGGQMQERMQHMHEKMEQARETQDPEKRREIMHEHMKSMRGAMQDMRGGMMGNKQEGAPNPSDMPMEKRMQRMEQHMQMMQGMMEQMMKRESLEE